MFGMRAYPLQREVGGGWALWNGIEPIGECYLLLHGAGAKRNICGSVTLVVVVQFLERYENKIKNTEQIYQMLWCFWVLIGFIQLEEVPVPWASSFCNKGKDLGLRKNPKLVFSQQKWYPLGTLNVTQRSFFLKTQNIAVHRRRCRRLLLMTNPFSVQGYRSLGRKGLSPVAEVRSSGCPGTIPRNYSQER